MIKNDSAIDSTGAFLQYINPGSIGISRYNFVKSWQYSDQFIYAVPEGNKWNFFLAISKHTSSLAAGTGQASFLLLI
jgi:hypothetical protein